MPLAEMAGPLAPWRPPWLAGYGGYPNQFYAWRLSEGRPKAQKTMVLLMFTSFGWWFRTFGLFFHMLGIIIPTD